MSKRISLPAKLTRPRMHAPVLRERIFRQLDEGRGGATVLWVDGPPGSGKTTAVATWLDDREIPFDWYQVDRSDDDPATLFYFLAELAGHLPRRRGARLPLLTPAHRSDLAGFTHRFFRQWIARLPDGAALVLDNLHEASDSALLEVLREAVGEFPHGTTLIAISRQPPAPALARLAASGDLLRVGWDSLRFQADESRALVGARGEIADADALHRRSGGWAAGLVLLAAQSREASGDGATLPSPGPTVFDYFAGEILDRAPVPHRDVMLRTALLPEISRDAAIALSGQVGAPEVLEDLYRRQYFTDRRIGPTPTWRYHDLFREFLLARLAQAVDADRLAEMRRQAAAMLATTGLPGEAVALYRQTQDWDAIVPLVRAHAQGLLATGRWQTLAAWFEGMPEATIHADAWVLFWWASCRVMTAPKAAQALLTEAFEAFAAAGDEDGRFFAALAQAEVVFVLGESFKPLDRWIDALATLLEKDRPFESVAAGVRAWSAFVHACIYRALGHPLLPTGVRYLHAHLLSADIDDSQRLAAATVLLGHAHFRADEPMLREVLALAERLVRQEEIAPVTRAWAGVWITVVAFMVADFEHCLACAERTKADAQRFGLATMVAVAENYRTASLYLLGRVAESLRIDEAALAGRDQQKPYTLTYAYSTAGIHQVYEGNHTLALQYIDKAIEGAQFTGFKCVQAVWDLYLALALEGAGRPGEGLVITQQSVERLRAAHCSTYDALAVITEACCHLALGDRDRTLDALRRALDGTQPWLQHAKLSWVVHRLPQLFSIALQEEIEVDLVRRLIRDWGIPPASPLDAHWPWPVSIRACGGFEVLLDGVPLQHRRKAPKRLLQLLKTLVAFGSREVPLARLADAMFPDDDGGKAEDSLRVAMQRLRDLLGGDAHVTLRNGKVSLAPQSVWVDAVAVQEGLQRAATVADTDAALALYPGLLLEGEDDPNFAEPRERLQTRFLRHAVERAEAHVTAGRSEAALTLYRRCVDADVLNESFCQGLLGCCATLGRIAEGETAYRRLETALRDTFGRAPSERSRRALQALLGGDR
jgi:LuxR family transcriptional regulator, maltose regulon positive regulatory protein